MLLSPLSLADRCSPIRELYSEEPRRYDRNILAFTRSSNLRRRGLMDPPSPGHVRGLHAPAYFSVTSSGAPSPLIR